jgi:hypothetical protein
MIRTLKAWQVKQSPSGMARQSDIKDAQAVSWPLDPVRGTWC